MSAAAVIRARAGWERFRRNRLALAGLVLVAVLGGLAVAAPILPLADPHLTRLDQRLLPAGSEGFLLGTDALGRDLLSRLVWGTRTSLAVGLAAVLVAAVAGTLLGLVAGYARGWIDGTLMRGIDVLLAFPYLLLALALVAALGPGLGNAMLAIAVANVPFFARTVRGAAVELAQREFVDAARLQGAGNARIVLRELLPNVLPIVVVMMSTNLGWMILETAGLSFLGLGAQPPTADLGSMLGNGRELLATAPRVAVLPGIVILVLVMGINLVGDGLRDVLDPRLREAEGRRPPRHEAEPTEAGPAAEPSAGSVLQVDGLRTWFWQAGEPRRAVDDVSFRVAGGERLGMVGESGSGKTVTALSLLGLVPEPGRIVAGRVLLQDEDLVAAPERRRRQLRGDRITYVPQDPMAALNPALTIGAQIVEVLRAHRDLGRRRAGRRAVELLERVRIPEPDQRAGAYPHELSGGMRQRAVIAMALANDPALIVADEATTALDTTVQAEILKLLGRLCEEQGAALVFISHDLSVVSTLCDRVIVLYAGRIVEEAATESLIASPRHPYTRALLACAPELGQPDKTLVPIPGQPPPLDDLPEGCHFAPRCEHARPRCGNPGIALRSLEPGHRVRCVRAEELPPWRR